MAHQNHSPRLTGLRSLVLAAGLIMAIAMPAAAHRLDFSLHKLRGEQPGPTLFVVGGIQGDEPGSFNAASLLVTHYDIQCGTVWVVPNLNFVSIIQRSRGVYGDLNRKFAHLDAADPEYGLIHRIKALILDPQVDMVLNLHDGSGFFRQRYQDQERNPARWGQCVIIDQESITHPQYGDLNTLATVAARDANAHLLDPQHGVEVMNTRTAEGNQEMAKTLTFFAIRHGKPAFGLEASKSLPTESRSYYHLHLIESFMNRLGIAFRRRLELTQAGVRDAIDTNVRLAFYDNKIVLDMHNARRWLSYLPLCKDAEIAYTPSSPIMAMVGADDQFRLYHGNRRIAFIHAQYFEYDWATDGALMTVDGQERWVHFGQTVGVDRTFSVRPQPGYRTNVIGFTIPKREDDAGAEIRRNDFQRRFSVDAAGWVYRVEVYNGEKFSGMILVNFLGSDAPVSAAVDPATPSPKAAAVLAGMPRRTATPLLPPGQGIGTGAWGR